MCPAKKSPPKRRLIQAYPSEPLRARLTAFVEARQAMTYAQATLEAIQAAHDHLTGFWAPEDRAPSQLFVRSTYQRTPAAAVHQTGIRLEPADIATIDQLAAEAGAPSRSAYICAAWECHLPGLPSAEPDDVLDVSNEVGQPLTPPKPN